MNFFIYLQVINKLGKSAMDAATKIDNVFSLMAFGILIIALLIIFIFVYNRRKKQHNELINKFDEQYEKLLIKIAEIKDQKNVLELQSSMDIIDTVLRKSMLSVMIDVKKIVNKNDMLDETRKSIIYYKLKNTVNTLYDDDILILSKIYFLNANNKLSKYILDIDKNKLINEIYKKIELLDNNNWDMIIDDVISYVENKYENYIRRAQLKMN